jgi:hypothetical protein
MYLDKPTIRTRKMKDKTHRWRILILAGLMLSVVSCLQKKNDNIRNEAIADSLLQEGEQSLSSNSNATKSLITKAMSLTRDSLKYYKGYIIYSKTYLYNSKFDSSLIILRKTLQYLKKQTDSRNKNDLLCTVYNAHCAIFGRIGQLDSALYYGNMALKYCMDKTKAPDIYINLSDNYNMCKGKLSTSSPMPSKCTYHIRQIRIERLKISYLFRIRMFIPQSERLSQFR